MASSHVSLRRKANTHFPKCQTNYLSLLFDVHMLLTGLQMRTASSPVINKAQSKPLLHQGKTSQHKNTGVFWELYAVWFLIINNTHCVAKQKILGWKMLQIATQKDIQTTQRIASIKQCVAVESFAIIMHL